MDFATSSIVILLLLLPGIGWRFTYLEREGGMRLNEGGLQFELVWILVVSFVVHLVVWTIAQGLNISDFRIDYLLNACSDGASKLENHEHEVAYFLWYCLLSSVICAMVGIWMKKRIAPTLSYDHLFANAGPWSYIMKGDFFEKSVIIDFVSADVLCEVGGELILYRGLLNRGFMNEKGNLERIILDMVERVQFNPKDGSVDTGILHQVAGDNFVIYSSSIKNINLNFITLHNSEDGSVEDVPSTSPLPTTS